MGLIVYTGGTFDRFHFGHVRLLRACAAIGEVVVSLNTDAFVADYKPTVDVLPYHARREVLESCRFVSRVIENVGGRDSRPAIESVKPNIIAIGTDWLIRDYHAQMHFSQQWLEERDIALLYIPRTQGISSTQIRNSTTRSER